MYSILPRHHFSNVQCALFPKFVRYCLIFSTLSLVSYYLIISSISSESLLSKVSNLLMDKFVAIPILLYRKKNTRRI